MTTSNMTERDLALVQIGHWPIDCDPARPLNEIEVVRLVERHKKYGRGTPDPSRFRPMVLRGTVVYESREK